MFTKARKNWPFRSKNTLVSASPHSGAWLQRWGVRELPPDLLANLAGRNVQAARHFLQVVHFGLQGLILSLQYGDCGFRGEAHVFTVQGDHAGNADAGFSNFLNSPNLSIRGFYLRLNLEIRRI